MRPGWSAPVSARNAGTQGTLNLPLFLIASLAQVLLTAGSLQPAKFRTMSGRSGPDWPFPRPGGRESNVGQVWRDSEQPWRPSRAPLPGRYGRDLACGWPLRPVRRRERRQRPDLARRRPQKKQSRSRQIADGPGSNEISLASDQSPASAPASVGPALLVLEEALALASFSGFGPFTHCSLCSGVMRIWNWPVSEPRFRKA